MRARACFLEGFDSRFECVIVLSGTCGEASKEPKRGGPCSHQGTKEGIALSIFPVEFADSRSLTWLNVSKTWIHEIGMKMIA